MKGVYTLSRIAAELGVPQSRVDYAARTRGLTPACFAGHARIFDAATAERIKAEVREIEAAKKARGR